MGRLADLLSGRKQRNTDAKREVKNDEVKIKKYNPSWLMKISNATGFIVNSDREKAQKILDALNRRNGHCPCGGNGNQFLCPCINMREKGICKCGLFENVEPVQPSGNTSARIKQND